jgi:hypothetical protein
MIQSLALFDHWPRDRKYYRVPYDELALSDVQTACMGQSLARCGQQKFLLCRTLKVTGNCQASTLIFGFHHLCSSSPFAASIIFDSSAPFAGFARQHYWTR